MADTGVVVIGGGVVGLAVAARLAARSPDLVILERNPRHGLETSSRNSEVIHGGMYYPPGSHKARLCVEGNRLLYEFCARHGVPHRQTGKLICAVEPAELDGLDHIREVGGRNGVVLDRLDAAAVLALEPQLRSVGALFSPRTGIVSAHGLMDALLYGAREAGAILHPRSAVVGLERSGADYRVAVRTGEAEESLTAERVVNAAGLEADRIASLVGIDVAAAGYRQHYCKGSYFSVGGARAGMVTRLVYPLPGHVSLGVHAVVGLEGRLRFGPDAEYLPDRRQDYRVDEGKRPAFGQAVRRLFPNIADDDLAPDIAGIRPKLQGPGDGFRDFVVAEESARGFPGLVNLVGIDSPGLTSCLAIADEVARLLP